MSPIYGQAHRNVYKSSIKRTLAPQDRRPTNQSLAEDKRGGATRGFAYAVANQGTEDREGTDALHHKSTSLFGFVFVTDEQRTVSGPATGVITPPIHHKLCHPL